MAIAALLCAVSATHCRSAFADGLERSGICRFIGGIRQIDWSTMGTRPVGDPWHSSERSQVRDAIWSGADPQRFNGTQWYAYARRERLDVLLLAAVASDRTGDVAALLKQGADPNADARLDDLMTPLVTAARCASAATVHALLRAGADVNARIEFGMDGSATYRNSTALRWASERGDLRIAEILIAANADPNIQEVVCGNPTCSPPNN